MKNIIKFTLAIITLILIIISASFFIYNYYLLVSISKYTDNINTLLRKLADLQLSFFFLILLLILTLYFFIGFSFVVIKKFLDKIFKKTTYYVLTILSMLILSYLLIIIIYQINNFTVQTKLKPGDIPILSDLAEGIMFSNVIIQAQIFSLIFLLLICFIILIEELKFFISNSQIFKKTNKKIFFCCFLIIGILIVLLLIISILISNHNDFYIITKKMAAKFKIDQILAINYWLIFLMLIIILIISYIFGVTFFSDIKINKSIEIIKKKADEKLDNYVKSYVYHQLKELENDFKTIDLDQMEVIVKKQLNLKLNSLIEYLSIMGYDINKSHQYSLLEYCCSIGAPIINELRDLIKKHRETVLSKDLFGTQEVIEEDNSLKTIDEKIDKLLKSYQDWEILGEGKI